METGHDRNTVTNSSLRGLPSTGDGGDRALMVSPQGLRCRTRQLAADFAAGESRTPENTAAAATVRMEPTFNQRSLASSPKRSTPLTIFSGSQTMADIKYHPLPWSTLKYDERKGGHIVNLDKRMLE